MEKSNPLFQISEPLLKNGNQIYDFIVLYFRWQTNGHSDLCKRNVLIEEEAPIVDSIS